MIRHATDPVVSRAGDLSRRLVPAGCRGTWRHAAVRNARWRPHGNGDGNHACRIRSLASRGCQCRGKPRQPYTGERADARSPRMHLHRCVHWQRRDSTDHVGAGPSGAHHRLSSGGHPSERRAPRSARSVVFPPLHHRTAARLTRGLPPFGESWTRSTRSALAGRCEFIGERSQKLILASLRLSPQRRTASCVVHNRPNALTIVLPGPSPAALARSARRCARRARRAGRRAFVAR